MWLCRAPWQVENAQRAADALDVSLSDAFCLPTDHVGLLVGINVPKSTFATMQVASEDRTMAFIGGIAILIVVSGLVTLRAIRRR